MGFKVIDLDTESGRKRYEKLQKTKSVKKAFEDDPRPFIENLPPRPEEPKREESKIEDNKTVEPVSTNVERKGVVKDTYELRVRKVPNGDVLYNISQGSIISILKEDGDWFFVETAPDKFGWVMKKFIQEYTIGG